MLSISDIDDMPLPIALDPDLLRAFVLIAEGHSFTRAALLLGRTQSAVSMQVKRLEDQLGRPVFDRGRGGKVGLTPHGEFLLTRARQMLTLNDEVMSTFRTPTVTGRVRLGTPDDYALSHLPPVLMRFAESHPAVEVEVLCAPSEELVGRLADDELDLTLLSKGHTPAGSATIPLWRGPLAWITSARHFAHRKTPLPLAIDRPGCAWSRAALAALDAAGLGYRIAYTSASQVGTHAPVIAGLAVTVSAVSWLPAGLRAMRPDEGLPELPDFGIVLLKGSRPRQPVTDALAVHIEQSFRADATPARTRLSLDPAA